jgi:LysM domain
MKYFIKNRLRIRIAGLLVILMLFGCAGVKEMKVGEKYEDSKAWFKEKWQAMGSKFSSPDEKEGSINSHDQNPDYVVYQTRWPYETLSGIAEWFTEDPKNWKTLAAANPKVRPNRIPEGTRILIPAQLVKTQKPPTETFAAEHRINYFEHKVQWTGESLSLIAKWYTGQYANWKALAQANPGLNPDRIDIGNIICIPPEIMTTKKLLPYKMVAKVRPNYFAHTVRKPNEKLADIADWYTGDKSNAKLIAQANPDLDPEFLLVGNEIFIPADLLKNQKPFYAKSIQASASGSAEQAAASTVAAPEPQKKKLELFGPRQFPSH